MTDLFNEAKSLFPYTQAMRRDFHMHPELGFNEIRTGAIVAEELKALGIEVAKGVGKTGVVGFIEGAKPGPVLLLRFDMDALPIVEESGAEYASQNAGVMHACGHDGHTAIGLTVAKILNAHKNEIAGAVKFCFQPSEEGTNGEDIGGAEMMIKDGVLENPKVNTTLSLHLWNEKPLGWVHVAKGPVMAGAEEFKVKIAGKGGHGAMPQAAIDPVACAAQVISAAQTVVSRNVAPTETAVVSFTVIQGGAAFNVIPQEVTMEGTIRTFEPQVREKTLRRFEEIVKGVAAAMECQSEIKIKRLSPALINAGEVAAKVQETARRILPNLVHDDTPYLTMGAEDMAFMQEKVDGCYFFVGSNNAQKRLDYGHHHPKFDFDEQALINGAALMSAAALDILK